MKRLLVLVLVLQQEQLLLTELLLNTDCGDTTTETQVVNFLLLQVGIQIQNVEIERKMESSEL
jgi:hypothetical protein